MSRPDLAVRPLPPRIAKGLLRQPFFLDRGKLAAVSPSPPGRPCSGSSRRPLRNKAGTPAWGNARNSSFSPVLAKKPRASSLSRLPAAETGQTATTLLIRWGGVGRDALCCQTGHRMPNQVKSSPAKPVGKIQAIRSDFLHGVAAARSDGVPYPRRSTKTYVNAELLLHFKSFLLQLREARKKRPPGWNQPGGRLESAGMGMGRLRRAQAAT